jgi:hypothetical protein
VCFTWNTLADASEASPSWIADGLPPISAPVRVAAAGATCLLGLLVLDLALHRRRECDGAHHHALRHLEGGEIEPGRLAAELALARKGWLERVLEAVRRK